MISPKNSFAIAGLYVGMALINGGRAEIHHERMQELQVSYEDYYGETVIEDTDRSNKQELNRNIALGLVALNLMTAGLLIAEGVDTNRNQRNMPTVKNTGKPIM